MLRALSTTPAACRTLALAALLAVSPIVTRAESYRVRVEAGAQDLVDAPVSVRLDRKWEEDLVAGVLLDSKMMHAQALPTDDGKVEVVWIAERLAAGASEVIDLHVDKLLKLPRGVPSFAWSDTSGDHGKSMDLRDGDRPVLRYMHTPFDSKSIELTKKPFHMVYATDGEGFITKPAGGLYPHHRGIYFGYNKCKVGGESFDIWHAQKGEHSTHIEVLRRIEGPVVGGHVVRIDWNGRDGKTFARETRTLLAYRQASGQHLIEFRTRLEAVDADVDLDGDPQHAGVQFRSAQEVAEHQKETRYLRPEAWKELPESEQINWPQDPKHIDMPWNAVRIRVAEKPYTVAYLSAPSNPDGARASERLYGRFGEFIPWKLSKDSPLKLHYRWWISSSHETTRDEVEGRYQALAAPPKATVIKS